MGVMVPPRRAGGSALPSPRRTGGVLPNTGFYVAPLTPTWGTEDGNEFGTEAGDQIEVQV